MIEFWSAVDRLRRLRLKRTASLLAIMASLVLLFQNCSQSSQQVGFGTHMSSIEAPGNGEPYTGKPGDFYRQVPGYTCNGQSKIFQRLKIGVNSATLYSVNPTNCSDVSESLNLNELSGRGYNPDFVAHNGAAFERHETAPSDTDARLPEMWCRTADLRVNSMDAVIHEELSTGALSAKIYSPSGDLSDEGISKIKGSTIVYQSAKVGLSVDSKSLSGSLTVIRDGATVSANVTCVGAGWMDKDVSVEPTFAVNFSSPVLPVGVAFSRTTSGTYIGNDGLLKTAAANQPRFEYDQSGELKGLLIESQATNLLRFSDRLDSTPTYGYQDGVVIADQGVAPDGTNTADVLVESNGQTFPYVDQQVSANQTRALTCSTFVKAVNRTKVVVKIDAGLPNDFCEVHLDLSTGVSSDSQLGTAANCRGFVQKLANDWYRVAVSGVPNPAGGVGTVTCQALPAATGSAGEEVMPYAGNGSRTLLLWGFQLEYGAAPTSYVATGNAQAIRAADAATVATSSWYNPNNGSFLAVAEKTFAQTMPAAVVEKVFALSDGAGSDYSVLFDRQSGLFKARLQTAGNPANEWLSPAGALNGVAHKLLLQFGQGNPLLWVNGASASSSSSAGPLNATQLAIGGSGSEAWNGHIKALTFWPARLPANIATEISQ
jgi:hypothetical protein